MCCQGRKGRKFQLMHEEILFPMFWRSALLLFLTAFLSCKIQPNSDHPAAEFAGARSFQLRLDPAAGSKYAYNVNSRSEFRFAADDKI
jgi:hypothetical protein